MILITGKHKALAAKHAIEGHIGHTWTVAALQLHPNTLFIIDEAACLEMKLKTVKYFEDLSENIVKIIKQQW